MFVNVAVIVDVVIIRAVSYKIFQTLKNAHIKIDESTMTKT